MVFNERELDIMMDNLSRSILYIMSHVYVSPQGLSEKFPCMLEPWAADRTLGENVKSSPMEWMVKFGTPLTISIESESLNRFALI